MVLPEGLVGQNGHGVAEVQAAGFLPHGQADAAVIVLPAKGLRQPRRFLAEKQPGLGQLQDLAYLSLQHVKIMFCI